MQMNRRHLLILLMTISVVQQPRETLADDGKEESGNDYSEDDDSDEDEGDEDGEDDAGDDNGGAAGKDHDDALEAVERDGALTLEEFLPHFRRQVKGRIVDVSLSKTGISLIFTVTFVDPEGRVRRQKFNARSGDKIS